MDVLSARSFRLTLAAIACTTSLTLAGCGNVEAVDATEKDTSERIKIPVETASVTIGDIDATYSTTATLQAIDEAFVVARASGIIEQILVEEGDYVEKGQILARLDQKRYELALNKARADLRGIKQELDKVNKVYSQKLVSDDAYEKLNAQYESVRASVQLAELDLAETIITAPISGYIAENNAKVGNLTESFQRERMFHIVQQKVLQGIVYLPESELPNIAVGQHAKLRVSAVPETPVTASVIRISPVIDAQTGTFKVTLRVPNQAEKLKAGMFSNVALNYATHQQARLLPRRALLTIDNKTSVFVVNEGVANQVEVTPGIEQGEYIEILKGLNGNEEVITVGHQNLKDATPVNIVNS